MSILWWKMKNVAFFSGTKFKFGAFFLKTTMMEFWCSWWKKCALYLPLMGRPVVVVVIVDCYEFQPDRVVLEWSISTLLLLSATQAGGRETLVYRHLAQNWRTKSSPCHLGVPNENGSLFLNRLGRPCLLWTWPKNPEMSPRWILKQISICF